MKKQELYQRHPYKFFNDPSCSVTAEQREELVSFEPAENQQETQLLADKAAKLTNQQKAELCADYLRKYLKEEAKVPYKFIIIYDKPILSGESKLKIAFACDDKEFNKLSRDVITKALPGLAKQDIQRKDNRDHMLNLHPVCFECTLSKVYSKLPQDFLSEKLTKMESMPTNRCTII